MASYSVSSLMAARRKYARKNVNLKNVLGAASSLGGRGRMRSFSYPSPGRGSSSGGGGTVRIQPYPYPSSTTTYGGFPKVAPTFSFGRGGLRF